MRLLALCFLVVFATTAFSQSYPSKPVRFVVPFPPGNAGDLMARMLAEKLTVSLKQTVIVDNRGGNVAIPAEIVARAPPDGHTLLVYAATLWVAPLLGPQLSGGMMDCPTAPFVGLFFANAPGGTLRSEYASTSVMRL